MELLTSPLLFLDCQTTGMRPSVGHLLEMAWGWGQASNPELNSLHSGLIQLPAGSSVPSAVSKITGIDGSHLAQALTLQDLSLRFLQTFKNENFNSIAVIHYAQFEKPFLEDLFLQTCGQKDLPFEIICSQILARKVFPTLPSRNIRGLSGYFGSRLGELRRSSSHVQATFEIWKGLVARLNQLEIHTFEDLNLWLKKPGEKNKIRYEYQIEKEKRLNLPSTPGIYRMKSKSGEVLYVGKATSLKDRVNSYFRGKKGRDPKKLEMLTQVWDFDFIETETALEAALLENDEIKKLDPPYNINLRSRDRSLLFYSHHFFSSSPQQDKIHPLGPFRPDGPIERLRRLSSGLQQNIFHQIFHQPISPDLMKEGFDLFCQQLQVNPSLLFDVRSALALGSWMMRKELKAEKRPKPTEEESADDIEFETEWKDTRESTPQEVSQKFHRLLIQSSQELRRSRRVTKLLNCHIEWESEIGWKSLDLQAGKVHFQELETRQALPWENLTIADYDRMSVLWSEISKHPYRLSSA